jgi:hypothetical protein
MEPRSPKAQKLEKKMIFQRERKVSERCVEKISTSAERFRERKQEQAGKQVCFDRGNGRETHKSNTRKINK